MTPLLAPLPIQSASLRESARTAFGFGAPPTDATAWGVINYITVPMAYDSNPTVTVHELETRQYRARDRYKESRRGC